MDKDKVEEIRHFILRVYGRHDIVGYGDKALQYCKDLLAALEEKGREMRLKDNELEHKEDSMDRIEEIKERYTEFIENQVTWLPIPMNREDLTYLLTTLAEKDREIATTKESLLATHKLEVSDLWKKIEQAEAKVQELEADLARQVEYTGNVVKKKVEFEKLYSEMMGCWQPLADAVSRYRCAVEPIVNLDKAFKGGHVEDFHIEQQTIDDIVASYNDLIAPMVFPYAPTYQALVKQLAAAREGLETIKERYKHNPDSFTYIMCEQALKEVGGGSRP